MSRSFIELSSYSESLDRYDGGPYFDTDLWPLVLKNINQIRRVLIFHHESSKIPITSLGCGLMISPNIRDIGAMNQLSSESLATLAVWSFGGHISVLYHLANESSIPRELFNLYPIPGKLYLNSEDELGITDEARLEFAVVLNTVPADHVVLAFAHDADPLFIFGSEEGLTSLIDKTSSRCPP